MPKKILSNILSDVTEPQREAITHLEGPLQVLAGAGSGKTRVITRRVCYLIENGVDPYNILAITFTNKAAAEMKERVAQYYSYPGMWISTFHSMCARILRTDANIERLGFSRYFSIYDTTDTLGVIKNALKELELDPTHWKPASLAATISDAKNRLVVPEGLLKEKSGYYHQVASRVYEKYQSMLRANNALDFDDLQVKLIQLFTEHHDVLDRYHEKFLFILIDEYQDTNFAQYALQRLLAKKYRNVCVTGDPDQSIYGWRGANLGNILEFENDYPDAKVVWLEQNYRSTKYILRAASELIVHNKMRKPKGLWTENPEGKTIPLVYTDDERTEAEEITSRIKKLSEEGKKYSEMAIFYRTNAQSRVLEAALRKGGIPYFIVGAVEFYRRKEIKDVLSYLKLLTNPVDQSAFDRVINTPPRGIGQGSLDKLKAWAAAEGTKLLDATACEIPGIRGKVAKGLKSFAALFSKLNEIPTYPVAALVTGILTETKYISYLEDDSGEKTLERIANVEELVNAAEEYDRDHPDGSLNDFLERVALVQDIDTWDGHTEAVALMTLHAAKGLEFPAVFICGLEEGLLPHSQSSQTESELEEERRLLYVGITRTKEELVLSHVKRRSRFGAVIPSIPSRFIGELPKDIVIEEDKTVLTTDLIREHEPEYPVDVEAPVPGERVRHPKFGIGRVVETTGYGKSLMAVVDFPVGRKTLLLEYARLERLSGNTWTHK
ncbi:MAG TPA: ATP-dependent helicase [Candidatus Avalokitesvara rifleensis]|uniref:ATP-dependent helicase n=1 Tax=Candidatus Avalokitesvara rifleensis TaxID=3367620 RepID=UPI0027125AEB|nr:3'-5' exonuclease [Candidatus Brocadiales bacterium]